MKLPSNPKIPGLLNGAKSGITRSLAGGILPSEKSTERLSIPNAEAGKRMPGLHHWLDPSAVLVAAATGYAASGRILETAAGLSGIPGYHATQEY